MAHRKRYMHKVLTFKAWNTVMRELCELRDRYPEELSIQECIESVRIMWANGNKGEVD